MLGVEKAMKIKISNEERTKFDHNLGGFMWEYGSGTIPPASTGECFSYILYESDIDIWKRTRIFESQSRSVGEKNIMKKIVSKPSKAEELIKISC